MGYISDDGYYGSGGFTPASIAGLLADYRFDDGSGTQLTDYSPNAYHGTLGADGAAPTWAAGGGLLFTSGKQVSLPAAVMNGSVTIQAVIGQTTSTSFESILAPQSGSGFGFVLTDGVLTTVNFGVGYLTRSNQKPHGVTSLAFVCDASADRLYINGIECTYLAQVGSIATARSAPYIGNFGANAAPLLNTLYWLLVYSGQLTPAQIAQNHAYMKAALAARSGVNRNLILIGNSLFAGQGNPTPADRLWDKFVAMLVNPLTRNNLGVGGQETSTEVIASALGQAAYHSYFDLRSPKNIAVQWEITNELSVSQVSAAVAYANVIAVCNNLRAYGWTVGVGTMIDRGVQLQASKNTVNANIRANWATFADFLVDFAGDERLGGDGANQDLDFFDADQTHLVAAGNDIAAGILYAALNGQGVT